MGIVMMLEALQQELALISTHPLLALLEAAEIVATHAGADAVSIYACCGDDYDCAGLLSAGGSAAGVAALERVTVVRGESWSAVRLAVLGEGSIRISDADNHPGALPNDMAALRSKAGLRSFLAVAIGPSSRPRGVLLLGKQAPSGFDDDMPALLASTAAAGLLHHVRAPAVAQAVRIMRAIDDADDPVSAISALLQSAGRFMWRATNVAMGARLALVEPGGEAALIFESQRADAARSNPLAVPAGCSVVLSDDPAADVTVRELALKNTMLASAINNGKARFIKDVAQYMQSAPSPACDVFTHASRAVSSLVAVPLLAGGEALGGLYLTQEVPCDFSNIQEAVLGLVHATTTTISNKLRGKMPALKAMAEGSAAAGSEAGQLTVRRRRRSSLLRSVPSGMLIADAAGTEDGSDGSAEHTGASGRLSKVSSRQLCTEGMLKVLQQQLHKGRRRSSLLTFQSDLVIHEPLGRGGFAQVYRGTWQTAAAAIKVMNVRGSDSEAVPDVMEMAVLSSVQHPNIVQVYCCLTNMVEVKDDKGHPVPFSGDWAPPKAPPACPEAPPFVAPRYRRAIAGEELWGAAPCCIIVMEFCDRGTLSDAVQAGMFHRDLGNGSVGVDMMSVVEILLDVAHSLQYIHRMHLLHSDIKLDNVLLKSDASRPRGVAPKLADFGLAKFLREPGGHAINVSGAGTVTHLAPEMFYAGSRITTAVDVYAFGVMMWEFYSRAKPYQGMLRDDIVTAVLTRGARPVFPAGAPPGYANLAAACWATDPAARPDIGEVIRALEKAAADGGA